MVKYINSNLKITLLQGKEIIPHITDLANLQIEVFKSYPYLQDMSFEAKMSDLKIYQSCSDSAMVALFDNEIMVGASIALPLQFDHERWQKPFLEHNIPIKDIFYFRESALLPAYRGKKFYQEFFALREKCARQYGSKMIAFCAVERSQQDPRQPENYFSLDAVWIHFGYTKHPEICAYEEWKEIGEKTASVKPLIFWIKNLSWKE